MMNVKFSIPIINPKPESLFFSMGEKADAYLSFSNTKAHWQEKIVDWEYEPAHRKATTLIAKIALGLFSLGLLPLVSIGGKILYRKKIFQLLKISTKDKVEDLAEQYFEQGRRLALNKNKEAALHWLEKAHAKGSLKATKRIAHLYERQFFKDPTNSLAHVYYLAAAKSEDVDSMLIVAKTYLGSPDQKRQKEGFNWAIESAKKSLKGLVLLAETYKKGLGTAQNTERADFIYDFLKRKPCLMEVFQDYKENFFDTLPSRSITPQECKSVEDRLERETHFEKEKAWLAKLLAISCSEVDEIFNDEYNPTTKKFQYTDQLFKKTDEIIKRMTTRKLH